MTDFNSKTGFAKPAAGDSAWAVENNFNYDAMAEMACPDNTYWVSPNFLSAALYQDGPPSDRRHFDTIQGAITAAEDGGYTIPHLINVYPGIYQENLTITGSCRVRAVGGMPLTGLLSAGRMALLNGAAGTQEPVIKINSPESTTVAVVFENFVLANAYNGTAGVIDKAMIVDWPSNTLYGAYGNRFGLVGCTIRGVELGDGNDWRAMISLNTYQRSEFRLCRFKNYAYGGGTPDGGVRRMIELDGVGTQSACYVDRCAIEHTYLGVGANPTMFYVDNESDVTVVMSTLNTSHVLAYNGGTGTNITRGLSSGEWDTYGNKNGLAFLNL